LASTESKTERTFVGPITRIAFDSHRTLTTPAAKTFATEKPNFLQKV
jgi:hypothetical protein